MQMNRKIERRDSPFPKGLSRLSRPLRDLLRRAGGFYFGDSYPHNPLTFCLVTVHYTVHLCIFLLLLLVYRFVMNGLTVMFGCTFVLFVCSFEI